MVSFGNSFHGVLSHETIRMQANIRNLTIEFKCSVVQSLLYHFMIAHFEPIAMNAMKFMTLNGCALSPSQAKHFHWQPKLIFHRSKNWSNLWESSTGKLTNLIDCCCVQFDIAPILKWLHIAVSIVAHCKRECERQTNWRANKPIRRIKRCVLNLTLGAAEEARMCARGGQGRVGGG